MGRNLTGVDSRIWQLHSEGFAVTRIAALVGIDADHVTCVITGVWHDDKLAGRAARRSAGGA